ncbi:MAG: hydrogenase, partial [Ectothiorhodospiraceae bacterium]|nr:hydrogenase [Ectothiorhodospiraceae bacterium]
MSEVYSILRKPLIEGNKSYRDVTDDVIAPMERKATPLWWFAFLVSLVMLGV